MFFKWEICWAAGVSRSRAPLRNATRRGDRTRRATSRRLKMTAASPTPSARRRATGPPESQETRPRRYDGGGGGGGGRGLCACGGTGANMEVKGGLGWMDGREEGERHGAVTCATGSSTILTRPGRRKGNRTSLDTLLSVRGERTHSLHQTSFKNT